MHPVGLIQFFYFYTVWVSSVGYFPFMFYNAYYGIYWPAYYLLAYYSFRFVFPADRWLFAKAALHLNETPYCNKQNVIFSAH